MNPKSRFLCRKLRRVAPLQSVTGHFITTTSSPPKEKVVLLLMRSHCVANCKMMFKSLQNN